MNFNRYFTYDNNSPSHIFWKEKSSPNSRKSVGQSAGYKNNCGYYSVCLNKTNYLVHRVIFAMFNPDFNIEDTTLQIDHIDGKTENNSINNLRVVTVDVNCRNKKKHCNNTSGITGVYKIEYKDKHGNVSYTYRVRWIEKGKSKTTSFSAKKYREHALRLAQEFRTLQILRLNVEQHAGYTDRHGITHD